MARATMSRDGKRRMTLRMEKRVDLTDLANALAYVTTQEAEFDPDDLPDRVGRERLLKIARDVYLTGGTNAADYWRDHTEDADEIEEWATGVAARAFPELAGR